MAKEKKLVEAITSMDVVYRCCKKSGTLRLYKCKGMYGNQTGRICNLGEYPERA